MRKMSVENANKEFWGERNVAMMRFRDYFLGKLFLEFWGTTKHNDKKKKKKKTMAAFI